MNPDALPPSPWALRTDELLERLQSTPAGLSTAEATRRLQAFGPNTLRVAEPASKLRILIAQFRGVLVALLAIAATISLAIGDWVEALAVITVLVINAAIGYATELRAARSMEALRALRGARSSVRRNDERITIEAAELVPGDIAIVEAGERISADLRVIEAAQLEADESSLTGESVPVAKSTDPVPASAFLGDRRSMLHSGTTITAGSGLALVVATGDRAEMGRIASLVAEQGEDQPTPLEKRLDRLGRTLLWLTLAIATLVVLIGLKAGKPTVVILETAIALAVASVPEGLPILASMILARGVHRMARKKALVQRLSAVETLGATKIICTDKTGTLTENRLIVDVLCSPEGDLEPSDPAYREALRLSSWCNNASVGPADNVSGDPLEVALLRAGQALDLGPEPERLRETPFDAQTRMMATLHRAKEGLVLAVKGAPEAVMAVAKPSSEPERWLARAEAMARRGLRVIAVARSTPRSEEDAVYSDLEPVALVGLLDPPRSDVAAAVAACKGAGIEVCMMTGDHPETARHIARRVGIVDSEDAPVLCGAELESMDMKRPEEIKRLEAIRIFARVSPEQKLQLVRFHQALGRTVAMTGDGVNDAPALRRADIGVAMGMRGTAVAREASEIVLLDDALSTIVTAVQEGRGIFANIRSFVVYLLSCNLSELLVVGLATAVNAPLPLLPLQILFLNLVTDVFPALALGANETDPSIMRAPPRNPSEKIIGHRQWAVIGGYGVAITICVLGIFAYALLSLKLPIPSAVTMVFLTLALAQLWHVFNMDAAGRGWFRGPTVRNPFVWGAIVLSLLLIFGATYWSPASQVLLLVPLHASHALLALGVSLLPLLLGVGLRVIGHASNRARPHGDRAGAAKGRDLGLLH